MAVKEIVHDESFLSEPSRMAEKSDRVIGADLKDTLLANRSQCVGLAANMIGQKVRVIVADIGGRPVVMYNPEIVASSDAYDTDEGCLSLEGMRKARRYRRIEVSYADSLWQRKRKRFADFEAQIIQHEIDHLNGILI